MPDKARIAIMGAGAMGGIVGAALSERADVTLIDVSEPLVEKINRDGLEIDRGGDRHVHRLKATTTSSGVGQMDYVVFFVKCYQTEAAAELAAPLVSSGTALVSLQNGWGNGEVLGRYFGDDRVLVGVTYNSGTVREPGLVAHTGIGATVIGAFDGATPELAAQFADALTEAGLETTVSETIVTEIWKKLILNAATLPTAALTGLSAGGLEEFAGTRELVDVLADEAITVAQARGYEIDGDERTRAIHAVLERAGVGKPSMLQDFEAGRRTEIDVINGAIVRAADQTNTPVPVNRALMALVRGWEKARGLT